MACEGSRQVAGTQVVEALEEEMALEQALEEKGCLLVLPLSWAQMRVVPFLLVWDETYDYVSKVPSCL